MSLRGNNFHHHKEIHHMLDAQSVSNTTVNGAAVSEPWKRGRQLAIIFVGGAFAASGSGRLRIQGQQRSDDAWVNLKESDGTTDLEFTATDFDDAGAAESSSLLGTLDLDRVDSDTYKAVRVTFESEGAQALLGAVVGILADLYRTPSGTADQLFAKQLPTPV